MFFVLGSDFSTCYITLILSMSHQGTVKIPTVLTGKHYVGSRYNFGISKIYMGLQCIKIQ